MDNIHFTDESVIGLIMQSILMMLIPIVLAIIWKIKTKESIIPMIIGAVTWLVFAIILKLAPAYLLVYADNPLAKTISGNVWLNALTAGVLAGVFEETGRFVAFKFVLKKYEARRTSITYGIGHGGFESIYTGFQVMSIAVMGIMFNNGMGDQLTANMDEAMKANAFAQLDQYTSFTIPECLLGVFERLPAIAVHISFSVLVFAAVREKKKFFLFPIAVLLHALFDFSIGFYSSGMISMWAMEMILFVFAVFIAFIASRIYKKLKA
jgi:uncharacterized membrane protein YhfC